ncbi:hypothetical protein PSTG_19815, partial [Puccinia striiformis f. sp. tritici PST-78]
MRLLKSSFKNRIESYQITNDDEGELAPDSMLENMKNILTSKLLEILNKRGAFKFNVELFGEYVKPKGTTIEIKSFQTKMRLIHTVDELTKYLSSQSSEILTKMSEFQERDSGWALIRLLHLEVN